MKKTLVALLGFLFVAVLAQAQEDGVKLAKSAGRALTSYNIDPANNAAKLDEAKQKITQALATPEAQALATAWISKGDIFSTIVSNEMAKRLIDPNAKLSGDNDALEAFNAYKKGYELTDKKYEKKDAAKGIQKVQPDLVNIGAIKYEAGEYAKSYNSWAAAMDAETILKAEGEASLFSDPAKMEEQTYFTAVAAQLAKLNSEAKMLYEKLMKAGTERPGVYDGLYTIKKEEGDAAGAEAVLTEGRKKFPNDAALLFAEINSYLAKGKLDELTDRLKEAIAKEPENVSLYVTLGNVYDNLYQRELQNKNEDAATQNFNEAKKYYEQAIAKDPKNGDAVYSLGALYYNKAAFRTQELNKMEEDFSAAGLKKAEAKRTEVLKLFDDALPYFQKSESINPNDLNTLIALNEIYARKEDYDKAKEIHARLDKVKEGGKNESSYFKE